MKNKTSSLDFGTVLTGMFCFSLDFGTFLTVWDVLFFIDPKSNEKQNMPHSENSSKI
jgi:hypothetical protein